MIGKKSILSVLVLLVAYQANRPKKFKGEIVTTPYGKLEGITSISRDGRPYYEWLGIPFAEAPVGELRFAAPKTKKAWTGVRDATTYGSKCAQVDMFSREIVGSEDCLFLNVFVPRDSFKDVKRRGKALPVMVWIHGGYFQFGSSNMYRPDYFMDEDVVLVTINYRLGAYGFLSTGDGTIRGNMGLKDQTKALKWVKENIGVFGGDPENVTLFGESAGGASVHYQVISPTAKGLINRAISQSGTAFMPWASHDDPAGQAKALGKTLGCPSGDMKQLAQCLRDVDEDTLTKCHLVLLNPESPKEAKFVPVIETVKDREAFLTVSPVEAYKTGKVNKIPWITGVNAQEGLILLSQMLKNDTFFSRVGTVPSIMTDTVVTLSDSEKRHLKAIREFYLGHADTFDPKDHIGDLERLTSDNWFLIPIEKSVTEHAKHAPVYPYWFAHEGQTGFADTVVKFKGAYHPLIEFLMAFVCEAWSDHVLQAPRSTLGVGHADELIMQFRIPMLFNVPRGHPDYEFSKQMVKTWVEIARGEAPKFKEVQFPKITNASKVPEYVYIHNRPEVIKFPYQERLQFWRSLSSKPN